MEAIFHEKQEGSLCAQHCLNALLQGEYFTAVDLASLAAQIDEEEREQMAEGGVNSEDYRKFLQQPSGNMDDSGYFSVQVLARALRVWCLDLIPYNSKDSIALMAQKDPTTQKAYICNYRDHWFTIRKIGHQWFNLNSLLSGPYLISDTYLSMFLAQLREEGYSIFIVNGVFPDCTADQILSKHPVVNAPKPYLLTEARSKQSQSATPRDSDDDTAALQTALQLSLETRRELERQELEEAMVRSLEECPSKFLREVQDGESENVQAEDTRPCNSCSTELNGLTDEEMLEAALKMSLETT